VTEVHAILNNFEKCCFFIEKMLKKKMPNLKLYLWKNEFKCGLSEGGRERVEINNHVASPGMSKLFGL